MFGIVIECIGGKPVQTHRRLDLDYHVRDLVLDSLELTDRLAELHPFLGISDRHLGAARGAAVGVRGQQHQGCVAYPCRAGAILRAEQLDRRSLEIDIANRREPSSEGRV